jgi:hypothetical protein
MFGHLPEGIVVRQSAGAAGFVQRDAEVIGSGRTAFAGAAAATTFPHVLVLSAAQQTHAGLRPYADNVNLRLGAADPDEEHSA